MPACLDLIKSKPRCTLFFLFFSSGVVQQIAYNDKGSLEPIKKSGFKFLNLKN
jgi:hypothetical protein